MIRGVRGATTVTTNEKSEILNNTAVLVKDMIDKNNIIPENVASVFVSVTAELNAAFPAKSIRELEGWNYVPVMCMQEIDVPGSLDNCIRVMITVNTTTKQSEIQHIYHHEAKKLRPDLMNE
ncbi:Chorismate mutase AroH [Paraliobacillus sp. PM-2]|uniref:chorismate mutase n=1 Tax=Paraliobacillus sp. PM-2 TaxID=1462524 RepID=UPI00061BF20F|nr:chorismate mutase [Paraliobacillus sp. PM-2]CQR46687.1 Chorismate mutase AroH [Paraliobacillus sp. PM-2]